jgi:quercetin dioxygenase-like cupin family protein
MNIEKINITKEDDRGVIYDCDKVGCIFRKKGTVSANHTHEEAEILYLVKGEVELTIKNETKILKAPFKVKINEGVYHKLVALTDIVIIRD